MRLRWPLPIALTALLALVLGAMASGVFAENIDPANDNSRFAWGENVGWLNAAPNGPSGPPPGNGVVVSNTALYGYMWSENAGWISLNCSNTGTCGSVNYSVGNTAFGDLLGYAWSENAGWISFTCGNTGTCGTVTYGVHINTSTGVFSGQAWGENIGWITFNCSTTSSCGSVPYQVRTSWPGKSPGGDSDGDGCPDVKEQQTANGSEFSGGRRDYLNPWDYFNPEKVNTPNTQTVADILAVVLHFGKNAGDPGYSTQYDRTAMGPNPWNLGPPDGKITVADIIAAILQFGHNCS